MWADVQSFGQLWNEGYTTTLKIRTQLDVSSKGPLYQLQIYEFNKCGMKSHKAACVSNLHLPSQFDPVLI
jgi:hypothetical protein